VLTGWRAAPAEGDLHQRFVETGFRDDGWIAATVPGHWRTLPGFETCDGPVLYRAAFADAPPAAGRRRFLVLDGVFYFGDVWLDETYLGATEGYFMPHAFDITAQAAAATEHVVAVEVACPRQEDPTSKRLITGVFSHWDTMDLEWNPGGLWQPVRVIETGPARIGRLRALCTEATEARGRLAFDATIDAGNFDGEPIAGEVVTRVTGPAGADLLAEDRKEVKLAAGANTLRWAIDVEAPPRWWPRRLGAQPLVDVDVTLFVRGEASDTVRFRTAFREIRLDRWTFHVNGERIYIMGSNHPPTRMALADATDEELRADVDLAIAANLDMLRVHAHVTRRPFYDAADERGLLLWQDFPLQWGYARAVRKSAVRQARDMVDLLGHRPAVALWCAHNEPLAVSVQPGAELSPGLLARLGASMFLPSWNKDVLDRSLARAIGKVDGTRPVDRFSGIVPGPVSSGTDSHLYFGWYQGDMGGLASALRAWPRQARFVTEFGAQAVPETDGFLVDAHGAAQRWPDLEWEELWHRHALQWRVFERYVPMADHPTYASWKAATQEYQAALLQLQCEDLRRVKYRPNGGFLQFCFADAHDAVTWSVLDVRRVPKPGFAALRDACRPVLPMVEPRRGLVHVVSERSDPLEGATVTVRGPVRTWTFTGDLAADAVTYVGTVEITDDTNEVEVTLEHPAVGHVANRYGPVLLAGARRTRWVP